MNSLNHHSNLVRWTVLSPFAQMKKLRHRASRLRDSETSLILLQEGGPLAGPESGLLV